MENLPEYKNLVEIILTVFTVSESKVKVFLIKKKEDPYKGYWMLPSSMIKVDEEDKQLINEILLSQVGLDEVSYEQYGVYTSLDRAVDKRVLGINYVGLINSTIISLKQEETLYEGEWFNIDNLPKVAFDNEQVITDSREYLKKKLVNSTVLKELFPSDFTLPEIQRTYEQILETTFDRRNFRKKFINLGLIEDTGYKNESQTGRPAKLYSFKDEIKERDLF